MGRRLEDMSVGGTLLDMHYGLGADDKHVKRELRNKVISVDLLAFQARSGCAFIDAQTNGLRYTNKMLVLIAEPEIKDGKLKAVFAYSYDDRIFGLVTIVAETAPS